jgi:hypothetical protein
MWWARTPVSLPVFSSLEAVENTLYYDKFEL